MIDVQDGRTLIITKNVVELRTYNEQRINVTWETCTLRKYLNGEFLQKFTAEDQRRIAETRIPNPNNLWYGTAGGNDTTDKIFLLSLEEVDRYFGDSGDYQSKRRIGYGYVSDDKGHLFSNAHDSKRISKYNNETWWWWLRSPGYSNCAANVCHDGIVGVGGLDGRANVGGVRPALWLNL